MLAQIRVHLHELVNALSVARGMIDLVDSSLDEEGVKFTPAQQREKIAKAQRAIDRIEASAQEVRQLVIKLQEADK